MQTQTNKLIKIDYSNSNKAESIIRDQAKAIIHKFMVDANIPYVKAIWWTIHKLMTNLFQKIVINIEMIEKIR